MTDIHWLDSKVGLLLDQINIWKNEKYNNQYLYWFHYKNFEPMGFNYKFIETKDVESDTNFLVVVSPGNLNAYLGLNDEGGGKTFLDFTDDKIIDLIRNGNGYILICYYAEGHIIQQNYKDIHNFLLKYNVPSKKCIFVSSNINGKKQYNNFCKDMPTLTRQRIKILELNHMFISSVQIYRHITESDNVGPMDNIWPYKQSFFTEKDFDDLKNTIREKYFLSYNRVIREYRLALISMIYEMGLQDKGIISLGAEEVDPANGGVWPTRIRDFIKDKKQSEVVNKALKSIKPLYPIDADGDIDANWVYEENGNKINGAVGQWSNFSHQYKRIYFNVVTESCYYEDCIYMSEKIFKPISNLTPFIIVSTSHFLSKLKALGFKTFSPWIDESYDEEVDNDKRFFMILDEIKRLCSMSKEEIHKWYYEMEDILKHNQRHFITHEATDSKDAWKEILGILYET